MPLIHCDFRSNVLGLETAMNVILPQPEPVDPSGMPKETHHRYPTLYLLHGLTGNHTDWQRETSIERYVAPLNLAVVMPEVHRSFYTDMVCGLPYWTFISQELPAIARSLFPLSNKRKDNFVAGLSMGGYGAFKLALTCPDRFAAAACLSTPMEISTMLNANQGEKWRHEMKTIFGDPNSVAGGKNDLFHLAEQLSTSSCEKPSLYLWCGTEDPFYPSNITFRQHAKKIGLELTYEEGPGGHNFKAWDQQIQQVLEWLPIDRKHG